MWKQLEVPVRAQRDVTTSRINYFITRERVKPSESVFMIKSTFAEDHLRTAVDLYLVLMPLKLSLRIELKLDRPLSLTGEACDVVSRPRSSFTAESGLSGSEL